VTEVKIDHQSATPVYAQMAGILRTMIESGEIEPDRPLPSVKTIMQRWEISQGSAERAIRVLKAEGLVHSVQGKGVFVSPSKA
jgi:GntR family transcriptional regulator